MEQVFLVKQGEGGCSSSVFRLSLVLGGLLLLLGVVAFVVAAFAARRTVVVGEVSSIQSCESFYRLFKAFVGIRPSVGAEMLCTHSVSDEREHLLFSHL